MGWKDWSYVKRGMIIGLIVGIISGIINLFVITTQKTGIYTLIAFPGLIIYGLLYFGICGYEGLKTCEIIISYIGLVLGIIIITILGSLIGFLYGKFKSRNENKGEKE